MGPGAAGWKGGFSSNTKNYTIMPNVVHKIPPLYKYFGMLKEPAPSPRPRACLSVMSSCLMGSRELSLRPVARQTSARPRQGLGVSPLSGHSKAGLCV